MKQNPQYRKAALKRVFIMPLISFAMLTYSGKDMQDFCGRMVSKYLQGITDYEINNFEALFYQMMA